MYQELENMFDGVIDQALSNLDGNDLGRTVIHHPKLTNDIYVPLRKMDDLSGNGVPEHIQNVMNSHQDMDMTDRFTSMLVPWNCPKGEQNYPSRHYRVTIILLQGFRLVGSFGFNGPLRQYFSLYRAVSQREGERGEKGQMRVKMSKQPPPAPITSAVGPCPTHIKIVERPGTGS